MIVAVCVIVLSVYNLFASFSIILTRGVGKNGSTVAVRLSPPLSPPPFLLHILSLPLSSFTISLSLSLSLSLQDTSVLSPVVSVLVQVPIVVYYAQDSPGQLLHSHCVLFLAAFTLPIVKSIIHMVVSAR